MAARRLPAVPRPRSAAGRGALAATVVLLAGATGLAALGGCADDGSEAPGTPDFAWLDVEDWLDRPLDDTALASWVEGGTAGWPRPAEVVLYRASCEVCGLHFDELRGTPPEDPLVVVRVPEPGAPPTQDVLERAPAARTEARLVPLPRGYGVGTPLRLRVDADGVVRGFEDLGAHYR